MHIPKTRRSVDSAIGDVVVWRVSDDFSFSLSAAASSSSFFFLKRVSAMGRKKVHSKPYCLQCWQSCGSESGRISHLGGEVEAKFIRIARCTYLIFRLRQLSHARCVLVRFRASVGVLGEAVIIGDCLDTRSVGEGPS